MFYVKLLMPEFKLCHLTFTDKKVHRPLVVIRLAKIGYLDVAIAKNS